MFCPKCGKTDQSPETYCRQCGVFLPDFDQPTKKVISPEEHLKANTFLNILTGITSLTLAILLYSFFLGEKDTPVIIYVTAGFLIAITGWQIQTVWRSILLKKHFAKNKTVNNLKNEVDVLPINIKSVPTGKLLNQADFSDIVPISVTEDTTKNLVKNSTK